jgi:hypothetical protein
MTVGMLQEERESATVFQALFKVDEDNFLKEIVRRRKRFRFYLLNYVVHPVYMV